MDRNIGSLKKNTEPIVCLFIIIMDIVAGVLGIEAEIAQNKVENLKTWVLECRDPSYQAFKLGMAAAVLLVLAHTIANLLGGCIFVWSKEELKKASANKQLVVASLVSSWIVLVAGFSMLISGTIANSSARKSCGIAHHRLLSLGGVLCFIHGLFILAYYVSATAVVKEAKRAPQHPGNVRSSKILGFFLVLGRLNIILFTEYFPCLETPERMLNARGTDDGKQRFAVPMRHYQIPLPIIVTCLTKFKQYT